MNKQEEQEHLWSLLIENELYSILECARDDRQRKNFLEEYCTENRIPIQFAKNKIAEIRKLKEQAEQETVEHDER